MMMFARAPRHVPHEEVERLEMWQTSQSCPGSDCVSIRPLWLE